MRADPVLGEDHGHIVLATFHAMQGPIKLPSCLQPTNRRNSQMRRTLLTPSSPLGIRASSGTSDAIAASTQGQKLIRRPSSLSSQCSTQRICPPIPRPHFLRVAFSSSNTQNCHQRSGLRDRKAWTYRSFGTLRSELRAPTFGVMFQCLSVNGNKTFNEIGITS